MDDHVQRGVPESAGFCVWSVTCSYWQSATVDWFWRLRWAQKRSFRIYVEPLFESEFEAASKSRTYRTTNAGAAEERTVGAAKPIWGTTRNYLLRYRNGISIEKTSLKKKPTQCGQFIILFSMISLIVILVIDITFWFQSIYYYSGLKKYYQVQYAAALSKNYQLKKQHRFVELAKEHSSIMVTKATPVD